MAEKPRILIIDDEEIVRDSCIQILAKGNYEIKTAENGMDGLTLLKEFQPDLALVDLKMPGISGFEVLDQIHAYDPTIVAIVITGFATVDSAVEAMKKGTYDFLPKPFTPDELRMLVRRGLERRGLVLETIRLRKEKELLRDHFAAIVSHELKSPLGAVQQNLFVLVSDLEELLSKEQSAKLARLQTRIKDMVKMINTWLRVISVDISKIRDDFTTVSIETVVEKAAENVESHAIRKDNEIKLTSRASCPQVFGDEGTLVEALVNILNNAVKYSRVGGLIEIETSEDSGNIIITITDEGVGIAEEDLPHIFDDFYSGKVRPEGERSSGVGLAITKRIVEAHDGKVSLKSKLGEGSSFSIHLPALKDEEIS
ncbi:MAG: hybrid sensor histidine kinase/response regulator [Anaerolineae bacterium]|nr:hybrid sensor histidine kinase/response regulator [Anaerolineae bacterium]MBT3714073.1 hybrid sensor histidine kinase/response regulator [Anaerolineae bacterium]MBT4312308.1 hybrid sensor histidine kinase/response regulator [Anaerolineae bacterium]MBT4457378.1 hybrid sensor histidine kinase/response regulator [Anaerolineae bacterium]MBT4842920.1 hybrid sensor histidine kinase/response regulator [Anaerolineae bacterium]